MPAAPSADIPPSRLRRRGLALLRYGLPAVLVVLGIAGIIAGRAKASSATAGAGVVLLGVALMVWMINWLFRMSILSNKDRDVEEAARDYLTRTGHWPDDDVESAGAELPGKPQGQDAGD